MQSTISWEILILGLVLASTCWFLWHKLASSADGEVCFPPGPPPLPIIGNLMDAPIVNPWLGYTEMAKKYGDLFSLNVLGQRIIVVNSAKVANDLFEKRSQIYSDRPIIPAMVMTGADKTSALLPYGDTWRKHRRLYAHYFRPNVIPAYHPIQEDKCIEFVRELTESPNSLDDCLRKFSSALVMETTYGHKIQPVDDPYVKLAEDTMERLALTVLPGAQLVNTFPILRHLPDWLPGTRFLRNLREIKIMNERLKNEPFEFVRRNMAAGTALPSMAAELLEACKAGEVGLSPEDAEQVKGMTWTVFIAGADTTVSMMKTFFLAMLLYPEAQKKAQAEIDSIIGRGRPPLATDRESLPYMEAVLREVFRWHPVAPMTVHATTEDDVYDGYFIPKGAFVIGNIWAINRDERTYPKADKFIPERYFLPNGKLNNDTIEVTFGFGRRICAGRRLAESTAFLLMATILWAFDIKKAKDEHGNDIEPLVQYSDGIVCHPLPFKYAINRRA